MNLQTVNNRELIWIQEQLSTLKISTFWIQKYMSFSPSRMSHKLKFIQMTHQYLSCHQKTEKVRYTSPDITPYRRLTITSHSHKMILQMFTWLHSTYLGKQAIKLTTIWHSSLFAGLCIVVLLIHGRITTATLMHHGVGPLPLMAALTQACRVSSKRPHPPVSLSTYQDIIWNKFHFDCILTNFRNNCPCVLTV